MDVLKNDALLELLCMVAEPASQATLVDFCVQLMQELEDDMAKETFEQFEAGQYILANLGSVQTFCRCVCQLLENDRIQSDATHVTHFTLYTGKDGFSSAVKQILTQAEPAETSKGAAGELRVKSRQFLHACVADVVRTAATVDEGKAQLLRCQGWLKHLQEKFVNGQLRGIGSKIPEVLENVKAMQKNLRKGGSRKFEREMRVFVVNVTTKVCNGDQCEIVSEDLNAFMEALKFFQCAEGQVLLTEWATKHNATLCAQNLSAWIHDVRSNLKEGDDVSLDEYKKLGELMKRFSSERTMPEEFHKASQEALYFLFKSLQRQAGGKRQAAS